MLNDGSAPAPAQPAGPDPQAYRPGTVAPENRLGDQVLKGLEKLGRSVESMNTWGSLKPAPMAPAAKTASSSTPALDGAQKPGASSPMSEMRDLWANGMRQQSQVYATVFEFELVQESAQSMMKSLKSLLTQGGG